MKFEPGDKVRVKNPKAHPKYGNIPGGNHQVGTVLGQSLAREVLRGFPTQHANLSTQEYFSV